MALLPGRMTNRILAAAAATMHIACFDDIAAPFPLLSYLENAAIGIRKRRIKSSAPSKLRLHSRGFWKAPLLNRFSESLASGSQSRLPIRPALAMASCGPAFWCRIPCYGLEIAIFGNSCIRQKREWMPLRHCCHDLIVHRSRTLQRRAGHSDGQ